MAPRAEPEIVLLVLDAGGGHRSAANALVEAARRQGRRWRFRIVSLQDVFAPLDFGRRLTGEPMEETYNGMVRRRQTLMLTPLLRGFQWLIRRVRSPLCRLLAAHLGERPPDLVASLVPNFNGVVAEAMRRCLPRVPFFVVLTDLADLPPHFWLDEGVDRVVVGTDHAERQALDAGVPRDRVTRTSGMILHPRFYPPAGPETRARVRRELGLAADAFVVLVLFGGKGSPEIRPLSEAMLGEPGLHVIAVCGDNKRLLESLEEAEARAGGRLLRIGFTDRVRDFLAACDLLVTKPGPGSLAEAFHQQVPVVVTCNARTIPQERHNARFVRERGLGVVVRRWQEIPGAVAALHRDPGRLASYRARLAELPGNRAVFEVLETFARALGAPAEDLGQLPSAVAVRPGAASGG